MKRAFSEGLARGTKIYGYYKVLSRRRVRGEKAHKHGPLSAPPPQGCTALARFLAFLVAGEYGARRRKVVDSRARYHRVQTATIAERGTNAGTARRARDGRRAYPLGTTRGHTFSVEHSRGARPHSAPFTLNRGKHQLVSLRARRGVCEARSWCYQCKTCWRGLGPRARVSVK